MDYRLDDDIYVNDVEYFFSLHGLRFEAMNSMMARSLSQKYGKEFRAISVLNAWPSIKYDHSNYIILNEKGYNLSLELKKPVVLLPDYEDVNAEFCRSKYVRDIADHLLKKQKTIYVFPFTTAFLNLPQDTYTVLGPQESVAREFDSKANQLSLFNKLGLPCNVARVYDNETSVLEHQNEIVPCYLSATYTSGGSESGLIYSVEMLHEFLGKLRDINRPSPFIASEIFEDIVLAPNVNALITSTGDVEVLVIADQILHGNRYLGNTFPSEASAEHVQQIHEVTQTIGKYLASRQYRGLFGCDFLINKKGELVVVDLNPRHQGGYVCNALYLQTCGVDLTSIELDTILDIPVILPHDVYEASPNYAWGHSKISPSDSGQSIRKELQSGSIIDAFVSRNDSFVTEFYKKGSIFIAGYIGYQVVVRETLDEVREELATNKGNFEAQVLGV